MNPVHLRLAGVYFFYFATVGAFIPFWGPYLESRGLSATQIGLAFALMGLTRAFMPLAWGWWADHSGKHIRLVRWAVVAALGLFTGIPFAETAPAIILLMVAQSLFWHALLSQFEAVAVQHLAHSGGDYSRVRLWGSVGFLIVVLAAGAILDVIGIVWVPWLVISLFAMLAVAIWQVPEAPLPNRPSGVPLTFRAVVWQAPVLALLGACMLSQFSFAPYYGFFTLFLERHEYSRGVIGLMWALGVLAEIVLFLYMARLIAHFGPRRLMLAALAVTAARWTLTPMLVDWVLWLLLLQITHALTFGAYHVLAIHYIQRFFPSGHEGRGQALYNAAAFGVGGALGSLAAGKMWDSWSPESVFYMAAIAAAFGWAIAARWLPDDAAAGSQARETAPAR